MDDEWEVAHGLDSGVDDSAEDPDADGLTNLDEFERRTDPMNGDMDGDGLPDGVESNTGVYVDENDRGTSPFVASRWHHLHRADEHRSAGVDNGGRDPLRTRPRAASRTATVPRNTPQRFLRLVVE